VAEPAPDLHALAREALFSTAPGTFRADGGSIRFRPTTPDEFIDAVLAAVLPAHRAMVLAEVAGLIRDEADRWDRLGYDDEGAWRAAVRIAATGAAVSAASTPPGRQDGPGTTGEATAVPEEGAGRG
jgi:hypothetical protein